MQHFFIPDVTPRTLEELRHEPDEVTSLVYLEDSISKEINSIRDHNKTIPPLGKVEGPPEPVDTELPDVTPSISDDGELLEFDEEPEPANVDFADFEL